MQHVLFKEIKKSLIEVPYPVIHCLNLNNLKNADLDEDFLINSFIKHSNENGIVFRCEEIDNTLFFKSLSDFISSTKKHISEFVSLDETQEELSAYLESIYNLLFILKEHKTAIEIELTIKQ